MRMVIYQSKSRRFFRGPEEETSKRALKPFSKILATLNRGEGERPVSCEVRPQVRTFILGTALPEPYLCLLVCEQDPRMHSYFGPMCPNPPNLTKSLKSRGACSTPGVPRRRVPNGYERGFRRGLSKYKTTM